MKNILITGGAGFLGCHLTEKLLKLGNSVTVLDNLYTGNLKNLEDFKNSNQKLNFLKHDLRNPIVIENNFDEIYNLACPASPIHYQKNPLITMQTSIYGAFNILEFAKLNASKVLQASTSEVYGNPLIHPQTEEYFGNVNPHGLRSCYDEGKRAAESIFYDYHREYKLKIKIVRIFNTYGPKMHPDDGRVISNFINQAINGNNITVYGDGNQTRSFCYVDDMVDGFIKMMEKDDNFIGPVNLGTQYEFTMIELAKEILSITNSKSKLIFSALPSDDPLQRKPDLTMAIKFLGWSPKVTFRDGLKRTIEYFNSINNHGK